MNQKNKAPVKNQENKQKQDSEEHMQRWSFPETEYYNNT